MKRVCIFSAVCLMMFVGTSEIKAQEAQEILKKIDKVLFEAKDQTGEVKMVLIDRNGKEKVREAKVWQKGKDKRLFRFTSPASEAGVAFLSLPDEVMYLYMPAYEKERRIASHVKNQPFAGTDFSYDDMEAVEYEKKYNAKKLSETTSYWLLELTPLPGTKTDFSKIEVRVNKQHYYPEYLESYDKAGNKVKTVENTFAKEGKYWYPKEIKMTDLKKKHSTRMIMTKVVFDSNLNDQVFTVRNLTTY